MSADDLARETIISVSAVEVTHALRQFVTRGVGRRAEWIACVMKDILRRFFCDEGGSIGTDQAS